jgi:hypothetical protein
MKTDISVCKIVRRELRVHLFVFQGSALATWKCSEDAGTVRNCVLNVRPLTDLTLPFRMQTAEVSVCNSFQYTYCVCKLLSQGRYLRIISIALCATAAHVHVQQLTQEQDKMAILQFRQGRLGRWRKVENASKVSNATRRVGQIGAQCSECVTDICR